MFTGLVHSAFDKTADACVCIASVELVDLASILKRCSGDKLRWGVLLASVVCLMSARSRLVGFSEPAMQTLQPVWARSVPAHDAQDNTQDHAQLDNPGQKPHAYKWWHPDFNPVCIAASQVVACVFLWAQLPFMW